MLLDYLVLELFLFIAFGISVLGSNKKIFVSFLILTFVNFLQGNLSLSFWYWEIIIVLYFAFFVIFYSFFYKKDSKFIFNSYTAVIALLCILIVIMPLLPSILFCLILTLPFIFQLKKFPKIMSKQLIFKFIFSVGWIIIGNILY